MEKGYDQAYGARPMRRLITRLIEDPLASLIVAGDCPPGATVKARARDGEFTLKAVPAGKAGAAERETARKA